MLERFTIVQNPIEENQLGSTRSSSPFVLSRRDEDDGFRGCKICAASALQTIDGSEHVWIEREIRQKVRSLRCVILSQPFW